MDTCPAFRLALLSDVHDNPVALDAVLADLAARGGADAIWVVGDIVGQGYDPAGVLDRVLRLPGLTAVHGNNDREAATGWWTALAPERIARQPHERARIEQAVAGHAWTRRRVAELGLLPWLAALPLEARLVLPDGTRLLAVHARPGADDSPGIHEATDPERLVAMLAGCGADLVVVGHTHLPLRRRVGAVEVVNLGSVSNPLAPDLRASYALLTAGAWGHRIEHRRVPYDRGAVLAALAASDIPTAPYLAGFFAGAHWPFWLPDHADRVARTPHRDWSGRSSPPPSSGERPAASPTRPHAPREAARAVPRDVSAGRPSAALGRAD